MSVCPACGHRALPDPNAPDLGVAQCSACGHIFEQAASLPPLPAPQTLPAHPVPPEVEVLDAEGVRTVSVRWRDDSFPLFLLVMPILVLGVTLGLAIATGAGVSRMLFPLVALGPLMYALAVLLLNRSTVRVADGGLVVSHGPLPWIASEGSLRQDEVLQLFVVEHQRAMRMRGGPISFSYSLVARTPREQVELLAGWNDSELLRGVESAIEERLGVINQAQGGEHRGPDRGLTLG